MNEASSSMSKDEVRLQVLRIAHMEPHNTTEELVDKAELLLSFMRGDSKSKKDAPHG